MIRVIRWTLVILVAVPVLAVATVFVALNTDPGRSFAEGRVAALTGGAVILKGLQGRFPDKLRLAHLEIRDPQGPWLQAEDIALDWSPTALLRRQALIHRLTAATLTFTRLPASAPTAASPAEPARPFQLPLRITAEHVAVAQATLAAPILGQPATLFVQAEADVQSLQSGAAKLTAAIPGEGAVAASTAYTVTARLTETSIDATLSLQEPENGLIARLAALPAIGPLTLTAAVHGPKSALVTAIDLKAGPLAAVAHGQIDLDGSKLALDVTAKAPAMRPAADVAWRAIDLQAHVEGPFTAPDATGHLRIDRLEAAGASLRTLSADLQGNAGQVALRATAESLRLPLPNPALFEAAPFQLDATARLDDPARPVRFTLRHPLLTVDGTARTGTAVAADATITLPDLAPLTAIGGIVLAGHSSLSVQATRTGGTTELTAKGALALTDGPAPAPALIGGGATYALAARLTGNDVTVTRLTVAGAALQIDAHGASTPSGIDVTARIAASNLAVVAPTLNGAATLDAHATGPLDAIALDATLAGDVGAPGIARAPIRLVASARNLPGAPTGRVTGEGALAGAPLHLVLDAARDAAGVLHANIERADWRSLHAEGALALAPGAAIPKGRVTLRLSNLADLRPFVGQPIAGSLTAEATLDPAAIAVDLDVRNAGLPGTSLARTVLKARIVDPLATPKVTATLTADGISAGSITGSARLEAAGPQDALVLRTSANLVVYGAPAAITAAALLDSTARLLRLQTFQATARNETAHLLAPAAIRFAGGVAVDHVRLGLRQAVLDVAGRLAPTLDATVTLRTPADLATIVAPDLAMDGSIALDAKLTGPTAQPGGAVKLAATGIRLRTGPARTLPPATLTASALLAAGSAKLDARLVAGAANLALTGQAPLGAGPLQLHANGSVDLALLDPLLSAQGRRAKGRVTLDAAIAGTAAAPRLSGEAQLTGGELQDFTQGLRITGLAATLRAEGDTLRIASLTGRAGPGSIAANGTIGILAPTLPVDLVVTLRNARPLASDQINADLDADLTVKGAVQTGLQAAGRIVVRRAELQIPSTIPASVAVLNVRRPGDKPPAPPRPAAPIGLDLVIDAAQQVFVRGRGLDAEMAGSLRIRGASTAPQVNGGLEMRRGAISLAGTTLTFTRGKVGFDGAGVSGKIDPTLDFAADSTASGVTATLSIGGYVSKPKITLSSVPGLPQDEVLAYLIFKRSAKELGPFQIAQIAAGLAELTGVAGGGGFNPLESVRKGLGLDRLSVGNSGTGSTANPTVEGGRYIANGVYVGAKQGTTGGQTQATVQIDITKGLKLETDVGAGQGGNRVGLTYQFEY